MSPQDDDNRESPQGGPAAKQHEFPDQTVDFVVEITGTPDSELMQRVRKLSPDMRTNVLVELVRRHREMAREKEANDEELRNLRFHAGRMEKIVLELAKTQKNK